MGHRRGQCGQQMTQTDLLTVNEFVHRNKNDSQCQSLILHWVFCDRRSFEPISPLRFEVLCEIVVLSCVVFVLKLPRGFPSTGRHCLLFVAFGRCSA
jgi:hypothetical protein